MAATILSIHHLALRFFVLISALVFASVSHAQTDIGLGLGMNFVIPHAEQLDGPIDLDLEIYYPVASSQRWMYSIWTRTALNDYLDLIIEAQHRSPTYAIGGLEIGRRGAFLPVTLQASLERKFHIDLGIAPHVYYREFSRYQGTLYSSRLDQVEANWGLTAGLGYNISDNWMVELSYFHSKEVFHIEENFGVSANTSPYSTFDFAVDISQVNFVLRHALFGER